MSLSRDLQLAITDYAPGAELVAGGKLWKSAGIRHLAGKKVETFIGQRVLSVNILKPLVLDLHLKMSVLSALHQYRWVKRTSSLSLVLVSLQTQIQLKWALLPGPIL